MRPIVLIPADENSSEDLKVCQLIYRELIEQIRFEGGELEKCVLANNSLADRMAMIFAPESINLYISLNSGDFTRDGGGVLANDVNTMWKTQLVEHLTRIGSSAIGVKNKGLFGGIPKKRSHKGWGVTGFNLMYVPYNNNLRSDFAQFESNKDIFASEVVKVLIKFANTK